MMRLVGVGSCEVEFLAEEVGLAANVLSALLDKNLSKPHEFWIRLLVWPSYLIARAQIERDKNHRLCFDCVETETR